MSDAAAFHGLATNRALPSAERLELALQALDLYEADLATAEARGYDRAVANLRDDAVVELVAQFAKHHNPETKATCWTCNSWSRSVVNAIAQALEAMKETTL